MEPTYYIQAGLAFILVLSLMGLMMFVLKKINTVKSGLHGKHNRLKIVEHRMIDTKNKAIILRCDDKDHLVIIGQNGNTVIKSDIDINGNEKNEL